MHQDQSEISACINQWCSVLRSVLFRWRLSISKKD